MAVRSVRPSLVVRALVVAALGVPTLVTAASADTVSLTSNAPSDLGCAVPSLTGPAPLEEALDAGVSATTVRLLNDLTRDELAHMREDDTSWLDDCGRVFVVDEAVPERQQEAVSPVASDEVPADVFGLASRPSSTRTIYLDFDGATSSGTRWRNGEQIVSPAYSIDEDRSTFSQTERAQVFQAWRVVAEDFAPFDVNVTTRRPDPSALTRSTSSDQAYGIPVVVTPTNSVGESCACGGAAYIGIFGAVGATDYQPAWIFTSGSGTGGDNIGQVISHEVGHTFGLSHDGTSETSYYAGDKGWAPIMGSSYSRRATHWSSGEYAGADNTEDDVAIISEVAPTLSDDHANGPIGATRLAAGTPTPGTLTSRTDTDAFTFTADLGTALTVAGPSGYSNIDVQVTVYDSVGTRVATIDPTADTASDASMDATWSTMLPTAAGTYTAVVDGVGNGDPAEPGRYSDFGAIGTYTVGLVTGASAIPTPTPTAPSSPTPTPTPPPTPTPVPTASAASTTTSATSGRMRFRTTRLPRARVGKAYRAVIAFSGPVTEARVDWRLPPGLRWRTSGDRIVITGTVRRASHTTFSTVLSGDGPSVRHRFRLVAR
ncbi:Metallo-peptidase family M12 [Nocardioides alpinus]|uniref:Metallo-peptidase family M12 n=1 Tax=Nocardioides alpinus TaxID=748909 RepID=A0A1I1AP65_9ACTN|nr:M12 family metallo-peptidase [Nocardioides alpinus]PKH41252.1 hypothetical protein CXG46_09155 [Nocardioides alpinus]SFB39747.1 Metallo-peptidase family M12 [Nocardioides alpinus]